MGVSVSGVLGFIRGVFMVGEREELGRPSSYLFIFPFMFLGKENILFGASHGMPFKHLNQRDEFGTNGSLILSA